MRPSDLTKACVRPSLAVIVAGVFLWQQSASLVLSQTANTPPTNAPELKIVVLTGEDGVNILKSKTAVKPVVEVRDKNNMPVGGVYVTFLAPDSGARVTFAHDSSTYSTLTDASGRAAVHTVKPVGKGNFKISVKASFQGRTAGVTIAQTNYETLAAATTAGVAGAGAVRGGVSKVLIGVIVAGVAAGVVAGIALAKAGGVKTAPTPTGTIGGVGTVTIGPPH